MEKQLHLDRPIWEQYVSYLHDVLQGDLGTSWRTGKPVTEELLKRFDKWGWFYKILRKVPFDGFVASSLTMSADALFSGLTEKQTEAILAALRHGYYNLPRAADVKTIAAKEKVPRTTFQEHLTKAENKLVAALVPNIKLFNHASPERKKNLRIKRNISRIPLSRQIVDKRKSKAKQRAAAFA